MTARGLHLSSLILAVVINTFTVTEFITKIRMCCCCLHSLSYVPYAGGEWTDGER